MKDILKELCSKYQIELIYTENKVTILSTGFGNNTPAIRAHSLFKGCPEKIARAIIQYYVNFQNPGDVVEKIDEYVKAHFKSSYYIVKPAEEKYKMLLTKRIQPIKVQDNDTPSLKSQDDEAPPMMEKDAKKEMDILTIYRKDFWGNVTCMKPNDVIKSNANEIYELDITVNKIDTY